MRTWFFSKFSFQSQESQILAFTQPADLVQANRAESSTELTEPLQSLFVSGIWHQQNSLCLFLLPLLPLVLGLLGIYCSFLLLPESLQNEVIISWLAHKVNRNTETLAPYRHLPDKEWSNDQNKFQRSPSSELQNPETIHSRCKSKRKIRSDMALCGSYAARLRWGPTN